MPKLAKVPIVQIDEPATPARFSMSDERMDDLCASMREIGLLQPIGLKQSGQRYEIEFGHRRFKAAQRLKWTEIPALIFTAKELVDGAAMLAENVEREDLTAAEEAGLFAEAQERYGLDEAGLCKRFRRSANYIADRLSLLRNDLAVFHAVQERLISFSVARELNKCSDESHRRYLLDIAIRSGSGAGVIASYVDQWRAQPAPDAQPATQPTEVAAQPQPEPFRLCCALCGGDRDPYNLVNVNIHRWELEEILKIMQRPPDERETNSAVSVPAAR